MAGPLLVGFVVGRSILGLDPVILVGALTGALTSTPALAVVNRQADSALPTVGYAGTYAFASVLLAIAGSILMRF
jgi:putative transport protein